MKYKGNKTYVGETASGELGSDRPKTDAVALVVTVSLRRRLMERIV